MGSSYSTIFRLGKINQVSKWPTTQIWDNTANMNKAEEYFYSGVEKANSGDYEGAIKEFDKAINMYNSITEF